MKENSLPSTMAAEEAAFTTPEELNEKFDRVIHRRFFLQGLGIASASSALLPAASLFAAKPTQASEQEQHGQLSRGDAAILRFLAAAELIESDLWTQYNELGGVDGGNPAYIAALENRDGDMPQYITDNTDDELSHAAFLNAYLKSRGAQPVNLDAFRTLPSSQATGAKQIGRLTNLLTSMSTSFGTLVTAAKRTLIWAPSSKAPSPSPTNLRFP
jgi:hypothetical protein